MVSLLFRAPQQTTIIVASTILGLIALGGAFSFAFRRMSGAFREQERVRRQLVADVAHELRTPLAILQGRLEGLADGVYPRDDVHVAELLQETKHLARLVDDLRTIANAEAGALELRKERTDIGALIREVVAPLDRDISVDIADDLRLLDVDPVRIREVLLNVLTNAIQHTPAGGAIRVRAQRNERLVTIDVTDTGSGIAPEDLPHIFDRFHKSPSSRGSGLGLAIAQNLVIAHGGEIRATSEPGRGTTITIALPAT